MRRSFCRLSRPFKASSGDGISQEIQYTGLWGAITTFPKRKPFLTNVMVATCKTSLADLIIQKAEGKDWKDIDWARNSVFTAFGFAYLGVVQWFIYVTVFSRLCPQAIRFANQTWKEKLANRAGQIDLVKQTALDNFVHYTFIYFPVFYSFKEFLQAEGPEKNLVSIVKGGIEKYKKNFVADNMAIWGLWIPFDMIIYAVPIWLRLPLNHAVSLAWTMILSWMRGAET